MIEGKDFGYSQIQGNRPYQEDDYGISTRRATADDASQLLAIVADGMGGEVGGAVASKLAIDGFFEAIKESELPMSLSLQIGLNGANREVEKGVKKDPKLMGMGCTFLVVNLERDRFNWLSVGDSLLYLIRRGRLIQLNAEHSRAMALKEQVRTGAISVQDAMTTKGRNALLSAVMGADIDLIDAPSQPYMLEHGDVILLASDGILTLDANEIINVVKRYQSEGAQTLAKKLTDAVNQAGKPKQDNTTVIVLIPPDVKASGKPQEEKKAKTERLAGKLGGQSGGQKQGRVSPSANKATTHAKKSNFNQLPVILIVVVLFIGLIYFSYQVLTDESFPAVKQPEISSEHIQDKGSAKLLPKKDANVGGVVPNSPVKPKSGMEKGDAAPRKKNPVPPHTQSEGKHAKPVPSEPVVQGAGSSAVPSNSAGIPVVGPSGSAKK